MKFLVCTMVLCIAISGAMCISLREELDDLLMLREREQRRELALQELDEQREKKVERELSLSDMIRALSEDSEARTQDKRDWMDALMDALYATADSMKNANDQTGSTTGDTSPTQKFGRSHIPKPVAREATVEKKSVLDGLIDKATKSEKKADTEATETKKVEKVKAEKKAENVASEKKGAAEESNLTDLFRQLRGSLCPTRNCGRSLKDGKRSEDVLDMLVRLLTERDEAPEGKDLVGSD